MARKTIAIETVKTEVNYRNQFSTCSPETRAGWNTILESMLFSTNNYKGFAYLTPDKVPVGCEPGIQRDCGDFPHAPGARHAAQFVGTDDSRRVYH